MEKSSSNTNPKTDYSQFYERNLQVAPRQQAYRNFHLPSWTLQEYIEAIQDDDLFKWVEKYLNAGINLDAANSKATGLERRRILLTSKQSTHSTQSIGQSLIF